MSALRWAVPGVLACAAALIVGAWPSVPTAVDDAWISARYAANLLAGHGLVYDAAGPAVEGISNLLWTGWLAVGLALGVEVEPWMTWSGLACAVLTLPCALGLAATVAGRWHPATLLAPIAVALSPHVAVASTNGLESAQWVLLLVAGAWAALAAEGRWRVATGALGVLLLLCRPEGMAVALVYAGVDAWRNRGFGPLIAVGSAIVAVEAWRLGTYGAWVPNALAAKADPARWTTNLRYLAADGALWPGVWLGLLAAALVPPRRLDRSVLALVGLGLAAAAWQVPLWMPAARLLLPAWAMAACALAGLAAAPGPASRPAAATLLTGLLALRLSGLPAAVRDHDARHSARPDNEAGRIAARLSATLPPGSWVAVRDAGRFAYAIGVRHHVVETHPRALSLPHHGGADADVLGIVPRNPEVIVATVARPDAPESAYFNDLALLARTTAEYELLGRFEQHHHRLYDVWVRRDVR